MCRSFLHYRSVFGCLALLALVAGCGTVGPGVEPTATPAALPTPTPPAVLLAAGDVGECAQDGVAHGAEATAKILDQVEGTIAALGDLAYPEGTAAQFAQCFNPAWGRYKDRTRPVPGNHEYYDGSPATGYFAYFGPALPPPPRAYYSYDLGTWHVIALDSNCGPLVACTADSPQVRWLRDDLATDRAACTLAYWHHPRFSSSRYGNNSDVKVFWQALFEAGADVVLSGHAHYYERFAPQDSNGTADPTRGIRQFIVGTGGASLYPFTTIRPQSEVRNNETFGLLKLTLAAGSYAWEFVPAAGGTFTDAGSQACHGRSQPG